MKVYSIQQQAFIEAEHFASSEFRPQDGRTAQGYYIDGNGLIHSESLNYSLIFTRPLSIKEFNSKVKAEISNYHRITIYEMA